MKQQCGEVDFHELRGRGLTTYIFISDQHGDHSDKFGTATTCHLQCFQLYCVIHSIS
jgi:hypothetical protein